MKVYATTKNTDRVELLTWASKSAFEKSESWCDAKFINIATTNDLESYADFGEYRSMVVYNDDQIASHLLLKELANA